MSKSKTPTSFFVSIRIRDVAGQNDNIMGLLFNRMSRASSPDILGRTIYWDNQDNNALVWKYPSSHIMKGAKLQVHDSQEAVLFVDGKCTKVFHGGGEAYTIDESSNIPLLNDALNIGTDGTAIYFAEIWFVNISTLRKISWFCDNRNGLKIRENDGVYSASLSCESTIKIIDTEKFLLYFIGKKVSTDTAAINQFLKSNLISASVASVTDLFKTRQMPFDEFIGNRDDLQIELESKINSTIADYLGLEVGMLVIKEIYSQDLEEYWAIKKKRIALEELGISYVQSRQLDIAEAAAKNEGGAGAMIGVGAALGVGTGVGHSMSGLLNGVVQQSALQTSPPIMSEPQYYYAVNNIQQGPVSLTQIRQLVMSHVISLTDLVWKNGLPSWVSLNTLPEFSDLVLLTPPPMPINK